MYCHPPKQLTPTLPWSMAGIEPGAGYRGWDTTISIIIVKLAMLGGRQSRVGVWVRWVTRSIFPSKTTHAVLGLSVCIARGGGGGTMVLLGHGTPTITAASSLMARLRNKVASPYVTVTALSHRHHGNPGTIFPYDCKRPQLIETHSWQPCTVERIRDTIVYRTMATLACYSHTTVSDPWS